MEREEREHRSERHSGTRSVEQGYEHSGEHDAVELVEADENGANADEVGSRSDSEDKISRGMSLIEDQWTGLRTL